ncbi:hypothetical protein L6164_009562 [Bauhinia variegata]|uniref:Uncharacterized protein n=1 Tax=Bauhinia variegata TaxID=167791 RepID=A0ACB9PKB5_BAUVA|nr:hypothetical protein L6164_009562 [Bauhinia variegata]
MVQIISSLVSLVKRRQIVGIEPGILVQCSGFDVVVVDAEPSVGITDSHVDSKIVMEGVVGIAELGERSIGDVDFDLVGTHDEPEHKDDDAEDDDDGADQFADETEDAVTKTAAAATKAARTVAATWAVVGSGRGRWDGRAIIGSIQVLFLSHGCDERKRQRIVEQ